MVFPAVTFLHWYWRVKMQAFEIIDVKEFTKRLFVADTFDNMSVVEAEFLTFIKYNISGKINKVYFDEENEDEYCLWGSIRRICFEIIKGKRTPTVFKLVLKFSKKFTKDWIGENTTKEVEADMYLNIRYIDKKLYLISSFSPKIFSMERDLESLFDKFVMGMFKKLNIALSEIGAQGER